MLTLFLNVFNFRYMHVFEISEEAICTLKNLCHGHDGEAEARAQLLHEPYFYQMLLRGLQADSLRQDCGDRAFHAYLVEKPPNVVAQKRTNWALCKAVLLLVSQVAANGAQQACFEFRKYNVFSAVLEVYRCAEMIRGFDVRFFLNHLFLKAKKEKKMNI